MQLEFDEERVYDKDIWCSDLNLWSVILNIGMIVEERCLSVLAERNEAMKSIKIYSMHKHIENYI